MKIQMVARRDMRYGTRRLKAGDPFEATRADARILTAVKRADPYVRLTAEIPSIPAKLKAAVTVPPLTEGLVRKGGQNGESQITERPDPPGAMTSAPGTDVAGLRAEYQAKFGKKPFHGWDAETLKAKIAEGA